MGGSDPPRTWTSQLGPRRASSPWPEPRHPAASVRHPASSRTRHPHPRTRSSTPSRSPAARPRRRGIPHRAEVANGPQADRPRPSTSSATATKAIPGAFMDRMILESFPYRVIEGLAIAAIAVGAHDGHLLHPPRVPARAASACARRSRSCEQRGWLGDHLLGSDYPLRLSHQGRRRRVRLRRGDRADRVDRRPARDAAAAPALPGAVRALGQAHAHQQRRDPGAGARGSSATAPRRSPPSAPRRARAPRCSRSPARSGAAA